MKVRTLNYQISIARWADKGGGVRQDLLDNAEAELNDILADTLGVAWASANGIPVKHYPADWDAYGRSAGIIRNKQMAEYADFLVAFLDGKSHGTKNMIDTMQQMGKYGRVILY